VHIGFLFKKGLKFLEGCDIIKLKKRCHFALILCVLLHFHVV